MSKNCIFISFSMSNSSMDKKAAIKQYIYGFWEDKLEGVMPRIYDDTLLKNELITDIVGLRRSGKTYFMYHLINEIRRESSVKQAIYVNCEHRLLYPFSHQDLNSIVEIIYSEDLLNKGNVYVFLDEVQTVKGWEIFAKSLFDEFRGKVKLFVSGSVKHLLSDDYGELLSGRHRTLTFFPLNFREYLLFKNISVKPTESSVSKIKATLSAFLEKGGLPYSILHDDFTYVENTLSDILARDVKTRVDPDKGIVIDALANLLFERATKTFTFTRLTNVLKSSGYRISKDSVINYVKLMVDVFLVATPPVYAFKYSDMLRNPRKLYAMDNGFLSLYPSVFSKDIGKRMENAVFLELYRRGYVPGKTLFYYKGRDYEVDFVVKERGQVKQLIQVSYASSLDEIEKRELRALLAASEQLKAEELLIITWDYKGEELLKPWGKSERKRVKFIPLWKWLLGEIGLDRQRAQRKLKKI